MRSAFSMIFHEFFLLLSVARSTRMTRERKHFSHITFEASIECIHRKPNEVKNNKKKAFFAIKIASGILKIITNMAFFSR